MVPLQTSSRLLSPYLPDLPEHGNHTLRGAAYTLAAHGLPCSCLTQALHCVVQSKKGAELLYRFPILLDACANEMQRKGDAMMAKWAEVMTCMRPKSYFLRPDVALPLGVALLRELWNQKVLGRPDGYKA